MLGPRRLPCSPQCVWSNRPGVQRHPKGQLSSEYNVLSEFSIADSAYVNTSQQTIERVIASGNTEVGNGQPLKCRTFKRRLSPVSKDVKQKPTSRPARTSRHPYQSLRLAARCRCQLPVRQ